MMSFIATISRGLSQAGSARLLRLFSAAVMDQVLLSGANLIVGFLLIRFTSDTDYGLYVLVLTTQQLLVSVQRSWLTGPLAVIAARRSEAERRSCVGAVNGAQRRTLLWMLLAAQLTLLGSFLLGYTAATAMLVFPAAVLSGYLALRREFLRDVLLLYSRPQNLLAADLVFALVLVPGVLLGVEGGSALVWAMLALCAAALAGSMTADRMLAADPGWEPGDARPVLREILPLGFWATVGALTYWVYGQSFNYILAGRVDLKAVADVNATRLMVMPIIVLTVGVQALLMPTAALWLAEAGLPSLVRRLLLFITGMGLLDLLYLAAMWLGRDWITVDLLHKQIGARDLLLILWATVAVIGLLRDVLQCALFALGRMKSMAGQGASCAVIAVVLTWFGIKWWGAPAVLVGQIAAEVVNLAGIGWLLREALGRAEPVST